MEFHQKFQFVAMLASKEDNTLHMLAYEGKLRAVQDALDEMGACVC